MRRLAFAALALAAAGCDPVPMGKSDNASSAVQDLRDNVLACRIDVERVPFERSEHCVVTAEGLFDLANDDCAGIRSFECEAFRDEWSKVVLFYDQAVITSLVIHGPTPEAERLMGSRSAVRKLFHDSKLLRRLFNQCLADEERNLRAQGLVKVTTMMDTPLQPGQRCYRKGYPPFATRNAA